MAAAEQLYAERGLHAVSNRQVSEAAGQGNSAVVSYHFGSKVELVRQIARQHAEQVEQLRMRLLTEAVGSTRVGDWVSCLVRPVTDHLAAMNTPTWYARFSAQVLTDPAFHQVTVEDSMSSPTVRMLLQGLNHCLPELPPTVHTARGVMARHLIVQMCVERERALADGQAPLESSWEELAVNLIDAITGLWEAPVTVPEATSDHSSTNASEGQGAQE